MSAAPDRLSLIRSLRSRVEATVLPLLRGVRRTALVDFPDHGNPGDSAIFLGQLACLEALGLPPPSFICDAVTYDREALARRLGDGVILLAGGGNFGDVWPGPQRLRERVIADFPRHRIVQLPQSIHFRRRDNLERARRVVAGHGDLTLLVRDERSLSMARREFPVPVVACPDMAFCLGALRKPRVRRERILWLARDDTEARAPGPEGTPAPDGVTRKDWVEEPHTWLTAINRRLIRICHRFPTARSVRWALMATYAPVARLRLRRGCRVLSRGGVVVTDRLHGHILGLLLGIPHVLYDNSYGKLSSFHEAWTSESPLVTWACSARHALVLADDLSRRASRD